jgi:hypothetical protein
MLSLIRRNIGRSTCEEIANSISTKLKAFSVTPRARWGIGDYGVASLYDLFGADFASILRLEDSSSVRRLRSKAPLTEWFGPHLGEREGSHRTRSIVAITAGPARSSPSARTAWVSSTSTPSST